jgi:hypothetical protein
VNPEQLAAYRAELEAARFDPRTPAYAEHAYQHGHNAGIDRALRILDRIVPEAK